MIASLLKGSPDTWYIQDGLELLLDGIYNDSYINQTHINNPAIWKDLSGNENHFSMINTTTTQDSFVFDGTAYGQNNFTLSNTTLNEVLKGVKNRTIEIVCKTTSSDTVQTIFLGCGNSALDSGAAGLWYRPASGGMKTNTYTNYAPFTTGAPLNRVSYSITYGDTDYSDNDMYQNGTALAKTTAAGNMNNPNYITIGARYFNSASYFLDGEICAIRVYNRELSEQERLHNLRLDIRRFGINPNAIATTDNLDINENPTVEIDLEEDPVELKDLFAVNSAVESEEY